MLKLTLILTSLFFASFYFPSIVSAQTDPSFSCLSQSGPLQTVSGFFNSGKFEPDVAANKKFDARNASFEYPETISHAMVSLRGSSSAVNMCWAGGYFTSSLTWHDLDISWEESKQGYDDDGSDRGEMNNTSSATAYHDKMTWTGMHVYNMHDAIRTNNTENNWTIQHSWFEYARDDCIENDSNYSGTIYDVLFDGCYTGLSNQSGDGVGELITMDKVLIRMEPMPYPYKWDSKDDPVVYVPGYTIPGTNDPIPFGHGNVFKGDEENFPDFEITNSVFLHEYDSEETIWPPKDKVKKCSNNTIIWLDGPSTAPNYLLNDFPGCFTIITDSTQGKAFWKSKVADWHARHPQVGANRKPSIPGDYKWPRFGAGVPTSTPTATPKPVIPGDANGDSKVDGLDYVIWLINYNTNTSAGSSKGDFDKNGRVDGLDYVIWLNSYTG